MAEKSRFQQASPPRRTDSPTTHETSHLLTVAEVAHYLRLHEKTIYALVDRGGIPHIRLGRCVRFSLEDVTRWLGSRKEGV